MRKVLCIIIPILICFAVGATASYFQSESITTWYPFLNKSPLTPPNIAFPIAWSILYICMGVSVGLILISDTLMKRYFLQSFFVQIFLVQLFFNFMWSISFFYLQSPVLGLINIVILLGAIIFYIIKTYRTARASAMLFIPYLLWVGFATYLNLYIVVNN